MSEQWWLVVQLFVWPVIAQVVIALALGTSPFGLMCAIAANIAVAAVLTPRVYRP